MNIHYNFDDFGEIKNPVITMGIFEGVHIGHSFIINWQNELAKHVNGESVLITFYLYPLKILKPEDMEDIKPINFHIEKELMLSGKNLDHLFVINSTIGEKHYAFLIDIDNFKIEEENQEILFFSKRLRFYNNDPGNFFKTRNKDHNEVMELIY